MIPSDSWKWLAPRLSLREMFRPQADPSPRPCLPAIEPLGDRVMLSITIGDGGGEGKFTPPEQILIGLLKNSIGQPDSSNSLLMDQLDALKIAGKLDVEWKFMESHSLTDGFLKIDFLLSKFSESLIRGDITHFKYDLAAKLLEDEFFKITDLASKVEVNGDNLLLPAVQKVVDNSSKLFADLVALGPASKLNLEIQDVYLKLTDSFQKVQEGIVKIGEDVFFKKAGSEGTLAYLKIKFEDILITSKKVENSDLEQFLGDIAGLAMDTLANLIEPPPIPDGPFPDGVVIVGDLIDDIITP